MLQAEHSRRGRNLPTLDAFIAATALEYDLTLATRNGKDFDDMGISLVTPWAPQAL